MYDMEITIRNITRDTMVDFDNDHTLRFPMEEDKLRKLLGDDEWIIVDSPIGEELTNILELNRLLFDKNWEDVEVLQSAKYTFEEIQKGEFTIIDFSSETSQWNNGNGVVADEWWKGYLLHQLGYVDLPFEYKEEMEDWIKFEDLWWTADSDGWRETIVNNNVYLVKRW